MKQEINPKDTNRAIAFELWIKSPMPMVTLTKTFQDLRRDTTVQGKSEAGAEAQHAAVLVYRQGSLKD